MRTVLIERDAWWGSDELRSELGLPGWDDFTSARERFFAAIERLGAERGAEPDAEARDDETGTGGTAA